MTGSDAGESARKPGRAEPAGRGPAADGPGPTRGHDSPTPGRGSPTPGRDSPTPGRDSPTPGRGSASVNRLAWIALAVAGALTAWQVVYALTAPTTQNPDTYESVSLLLTLVLSVGAIVLGVVALGQRAVPRWPAAAATAVGAFAFVVCVATWIGVLMA